MRQVKVEELRGYVFDSVTQMTNISQNYKSCLNGKIENLNTLLESNIAQLTERLEELKAVRDFISTGKQIYLFKNNDSEYLYYDSNGNQYEYCKVRDKPILIDKNFNVYEIIEYTDMYDLGQKKGSQSCTVSYIDKVVKVKKICGKVGNKNA